MMEEDDEGFRYFERQMFNNESKKIDYIDTKM